MEDEGRGVAVASEGIKIAKPEAEEEPRGNRVNDSPGPTVPLGEPLAVAEDDASNPVSVINEPDGNDEESNEDKGPHAPEPHVEANVEVESTSDEGATNSGGHERNQDASTHVSIDGQGDGGGGSAESQSLTNAQAVGSTLAENASLIRNSLPNRDD